MTVLFLLSTLTVGLVWSAPAGALTQQEIQDCFSSFNGQRVTTLNGSIFSPDNLKDKTDLFNKCKDTNNQGNCTANQVSGNGQDPSTVPYAYEVKCTTPQAQSNEGNAKAKEIFTEAIRKDIGNICGNNANCRSNIVDSFSTCFDGYINDNSYTYMDFEANKLANCTTGKIGLNNNSQTNTKLRETIKNSLDDVKKAVAEIENAAVGSTNNERCGVKGVGYIICPVTSFLADLTDNMFKVLTVLLEIQPSMFNNDSKTYKSWLVMRNIANVVFVLVFIILTFSQITGMAIQNYGIKKMLPKLIIAAILVNLSFWICAAAVDISNMLGYSINSLFSNNLILDSDNVQDETAWSVVVEWVLAAGGTTLAGFATTSAILAAGGWMAALAALLPLLIAAFGALVTVVVVLVARQALITILIVISPLAFVAMLLPNTESWFTKWRKLLTTLLLMFPVIALVFGGSQLAAEIIRLSAEENTNILLYIAALGVGVIPLFITPLVMKTAGGLLNRFGGIVNNPNRGPIDGLRKKAEGLRDRTKVSSSLANMNSKARFNPFRSSLRKKARIDSINSSRESELKRANTSYIADEAKNNPKFRSQMASGGSDGAESRVLANAILTKDRLEADEITAENAVIKVANLTTAEKALVANGSTVTKNGYEIDGSNTSTRMAARREVIDSGDTRLINDIIDQAATGPNRLIANNPEGAGELNDLAEALMKSSNRPAYIQAGDIEAIRNSGTIDSTGAALNAKTSSEMIRTAIKDNVYTPEKQASMGRDEMNTVRTEIETIRKENNNTFVGSPYFVHIQKFVKNASTALNDPRLSTMVGKQSEMMEKTAAGNFNP